MTDDGLHHLQDGGQEVSGEENGGHWEITELGVVEIECKSLRLGDNIML